MGNLVVSPIEWAYLAGIVDGEGCVRAIECKPGKRNKSPRFRVQLTVTNTSERLVNWIHGRFGGNVYVTHQVGQWKATRTCWRIMWSPSSSEEVLRGMLPYLIVKKDQAELCFRLREMTRATRTDVTRRKENLLPPELIAERRAIVQAVKDAKKTQ
jgi:hypothetical protein